VNSRSDLVARQNGLTGSRLPDDMSEREWKEAGKTLGPAERVVMWWIGDWWACGEHRFG
jgi:hypothetical protein